MLRKDNRAHSGQFVAVLVKATQMKSRAITPDPAYGLGRIVAEDTRSGKEVSLFELPGFGCGLVLRRLSIGMSSPGGSAKTATICI